MSNWVSSAAKVVILPWVIIAVCTTAFIVWYARDFVGPRQSASTIDTTLLPDQRYATVACGARIQGISVPANGYQLPNHCRTVISVNSGAVRVFQGEGLRTFDMGAGIRSNPYFIQRVYAIDGWTNIDIITLPRGQDTYNEDDYKRDHPLPPWSRYQ